MSAAAREAHRRASGDCRTAPPHAHGTTHGPSSADAPGLYVFRFSEVNNVDAEEIAKLWLEAWSTFESTQTYRAEPQGLFCQHDRDATRGIMLLCTWYDGLESWQRSREPPAAAAENFRRQHALTHGTIAYATRLIPPA